MIYAQAALTVSGETHGPNNESCCAPASLARFCIASFPCQSEARTYTRAFKRGSSPVDRCKDSYQRRESHACNRLAPCTHDPIDLRERAASFRQNMAHVQRCRERDRFVFVALAMLDMHVSCDKVGQMHRSAHPRHGQHGDKQWCGSVKPASYPVPCYAGCYPLPGTGSGAVYSLRQLLHAR